jgi:hypothetical protein
MARSFNGTTDQIDCGTGVQNPSAGIGISVWIYPTTLTPAYQAVYVKFNSANANLGGHAILLKSTGKLAVYLSIVATARGFDPGTITVSQNVWTHVFLHYRNSVSGQAGFRLFVNGALDSNSAANLGALGTTFQAGDKTSIGTDFNNAGRNFKGGVAELAMWNTDINGPEIVNLAQGTRPWLVRPQNLCHYMPLDGIESPEPDLNRGGTTLKNNGTLTGTSQTFIGPPVFMMTPRRPPIIDVQRAARAAKNSALIID